MSEEVFDYEDVCMGVRDTKPASYRLSFLDDYRLGFLAKSVQLGAGKLLDIGCGGGRISESLPYYYPKGKIFGCDVSKSAIKYAKNFGSGNVTYSVINGKKLPYKNNFFDACICLDVLEHIPDVPYFLKEVRRVMKKNGTFFVIVPCEGEPFTYTWFFQKLGIGDTLTFDYFGHIHPEFTHAHVLDLLKSFGFVIQEKRYSEHVFYQWLHVLIFFMPKILLQAIFGKKIAHAYTNSSLLQTPKKSGLLMAVRNVWFAVFNFLMRYPMPLETMLLQNIKFAAWKLHVKSTLK